MPSEVESPICTTARHDERSGGLLGAAPLPVPRSPALARGEAAGRLAGVPGRARTPLRLPADDEVVVESAGAGCTAPARPIPATTVTAVAPPMAAQAREPMTRSPPEVRAPPAADRAMPYRLLDEAPGQRGGADTRRHLRGAANDAPMALRGGCQHDDGKVPQVDAVRPHAHPSQ